MVHYASAFTRSRVQAHRSGYTYDPAGNLLGAAMPGAGLTYSYDARNLPVAASRTNGVATNVSYDPLGRVLSLIHANGPTALNTQTYSYDQAGYLSSAANDISHPLITQASAATADQANELLTNAQTVYTYDTNGNRLTETGTSGTLTYQWDSRNRLSSITDASGNKTVMQYDFARNLLAINHTSGGSTTTQKFLVDTLTNVVSLTDASGLPVAVLTGQSIDSHYASIDSAGNIAFGIGDALGSTTGVTNSAGVITSKLDYEPYGQTTGTSPETYPFAYTGRVSVLGNIYYYRNRFYDTGVGRFLSEDPIGLIGGPNAFVYALGNPIGSIDPSGLDVWIETGDPKNQAPFHLKVCAGVSLWTSSCTSFFDVAPGRAVTLRTLTGEKGQVQPDPYRTYQVYDGYCLKTTPSETAEVQAYLKSLEYQNGTYCLIGGSCRDFSFRTFSEIKLRISIERTKPNGEFN